MSIGLNFPVSPYYREHIKDGLTISRASKWWSAVLLIEDPRSEKLIINLYLWESIGGVWKTRKSFTIRSQKNLSKLLEALTTFGPMVP